MSMTASPVHAERVLTVLDHVRLAGLLRRGAQQAHAPSSTLVDLIDAADLVPSREVDPDVVTMYTQVLVADADGTRRKLTLCYPSDAEPESGFVSVLSPVGAALLGQRVGGIARWTTPTGETRAAEVVAILFQPEASGDYTT